MRNVIPRLLKLLRRNKPRDPDPLVGSFFLAIRECAVCHTVQVYRKGCLTERIPGAWAYVVQPFGLGPECSTSQYRHSYIVQGTETDGWLLYYANNTGWTNMVRDEQGIARSAEKHTHSDSHNVN
jgi:hypothetical protein